MALGSGEQIVEAHTVDDVVEAKAELLDLGLEKRKWTTRSMTSLVLGSLFAIGLTVGLSIFFTSDRQDKDPETSAPTLAPSLSPDNRLATIAEIVTRGTAVSAHLLLQQDPTRPQFQALEWIARNDPHEASVDDPGHVRQRHALVVFFFSAGGRNWTNHFEFLSSSHECSRSGALLCDGLAITRTDLSKNNLMGQLPEELALLSSLEAVVMNENQMSGSLPIFCHIFGAWNFRETLLTWNRYELAPTPLLELFPKSLGLLPS